jgi:anti-sigma-K factor RskA
VTFEVAMRCDELKDLLPLHPLDLLDSEEAAAVREHLDAGCPRCAAEIAAVRETLALLPLALPAEEPSPMAKSRLMATARRESAPVRAPHVPPKPLAPPPHRYPAWAYATAASLAAALVSAVLTAGVLSRRNEGVSSDLRAQLARQEGLLQRQTEELASLRREMHDARESIQLVSSPGVEVIDLQGQGARAQSAARIFWDRRRALAQVYAADLPPAGQGKTYQLWFITADARKLSGGTFDAGAAGQGAFHSSIPKDSGAIVAAAITDEPAGGSPQPTGSILLLGKV